MGKKKSTSQSTQTSNSVSTPTNPEWVQNTAQGLTTGIQKIGGMDPYSLISPISDLEKQAAQGAGNLGQGLGGGSDAVGGDAWFSKLLAGSTPSVSSASLLDNLEAYYNPYRDQVTGAAMADFDAEAGRTRASQDLALANGGAFGGSGAALTKSLTEGELSRARNTQLTKLLSDMFTTSADLSGQDANRRQQASAANAQLALEDSRMKGQLALDRENSQRANVASQAALGQQLRGADQAMRQAPLSVLGSQVDMFSGLPLQLFQGNSSNSTETGTTKTTEKQSLLDSIQQIAGIYAGVKGA